MRDASVTSQNSNRIGIGDECLQNMRYDINLGTMIVKFMTETFSKEKQTFCDTEECEQAAN